MKHKIDADKIDKKAFSRANKVIENDAEEEYCSYNDLIDLLQGFVPPQICDDMGITKEDGVKYCLQFLAAQLGVTPEQYRMVYDIVQTNHLYLDDESQIMDSLFDEYFENHPDNTKKKDVESFIAAGKDKTLLLKVQLKGVTNPPMWREVEVPAHFMFIELSDVIQELTGLEDCHMWQFCQRGYTNNLCIAREPDFLDDFALYVTDDADETPLMMYLAQEGDTLEYQYDFGDMWVFTVKVKKVLDKKSTNPVCTNYKSEFNAFEDLGGPHAYKLFRAYADPKSGMTEKERNELENNWIPYFKSKNDFKDWIKGNTFNIEETNDYFDSIFE